MEDVGILSFVDRLASGEPTPGGGAAAGVGGSMGVGATLMAIRFSTNSKKITEEDVETLNNAVEKLEDNKKTFIDLIEKDQEDFQPLSEAYRMPSETEEEKVHKEEAIQRGLAKATQAPLENIYEIEKVVKVVEEVLPLIKRSIVSDMGVGLQLIRATLNSSKLNVYINAGLMSDEEQKNKHFNVASDFVDSLNNQIDSLFEEIQGKIKR